jgi:FhaA, N-terminal domain/FHA domain
VPNLRDFERRLGGLVEGLFSRTFRSGLQPVELAKRLIKEMDAGRTVGVSEVWAPNRFEFTIAPDDAARFEHADTALARELERVALENADERGWDLMGPPEVTFEIDDTLRKGDFDCIATLVEGSEPAEPKPAAPTSDRALVVRENGTVRTVSLDKEVVTIGRLTGCDVVLNDKGASRRHAQLRTKDGVTTLTDLGSTNGTRLNGRTVQSGVLAPGDRITIGSTVLEFRSA